MKFLDSIGFKILACVVFGIGSAWRFSEYFGEEPHGMKLFGGIVFGLISIFYLIDIVKYFRKKKSRNEVGPVD